MSIKVDVQDGGNVVEIKVAGRFDFNDHQDFRDAYEGAGSPSTKYIVNLAATEYMDSSALGMLLVMREHAGGANADISIVNASPEIQKLLDVANYGKLFDIRENVT